MTLYKFQNCPPLSTTSNPPHPDAAAAPVKVQVRFLRPSLRQSVNWTYKMKIISLTALYIDKQKEFKAHTHKSITYAANAHKYRGRRRRPSKQAGHRRFLAGKTPNWLHD